VPADGLEAATLTELRALGEDPSTSPLAALAVSLARQIDTARGAVAAAAAALQYRATLGELRAQVAARRPVRDGIDDLRAKRAARRGA
jgi:hypothetical protein